MKSLWFLIYDIVSINGRRHLESTGIFCQTSGFFLSMGIEAADAAVFLIALHSTVHIFWPNRAGGESGLYPYRRMAYSFYIFWPILMASLAFANGVPAYVNTGQSCYLPTTPWWHRVALSWIPRYVILLIILIMYGSSYAYVRLMMRRYSRRDSDKTAGRPIRTAPSTPHLVLHGLLPSPPGSARPSSYRFPSVGRVERDFSPIPPEDSTGAEDSYRKKIDRIYPGVRMKGSWSWKGFEAGASMPPGAISPLPISPLAMNPLTGPIEPIWETDDASAFSQAPETALFKPAASVTTIPALVQATVLRGRAPPDFYRQPMADHLATTSLGAAVAAKSSQVNPLAIGGSHSPQTASQVHISTALRQGPLSDDAASLASRSSSSSSGFEALDQATFESGGISRSRDRVRRQLRLLFVYPAVYACVWVFPFASDILTFRRASADVGDVAGATPLWLLVVSLLSLCGQGAYNAVVFWSRERPWRHVRGGFWESFDVDFVRGWRFTLRKDSGRTREEMFNDSARARTRRGEELTQEHEFRGSLSGRAPAAVGAMNWFDADVFAGTGGGGRQGQDGWQGVRKQSQGQPQAHGETQEKTVDSKLDAASAGCDDHA